jgi:hypothetical protein
LQLAIGLLLGSGDDYLGARLNHVAGLVALLVMVMVAAHSGYRLHIGPTGITFEQNAQITQR